MAIGHPAHMIEIKCSHSGFGTHTPAIRHFVCVKTSVGEQRIDEVSASNIVYVSSEASTLFHGLSSILAIYPCVLPNEQNEALLESDHLLGMV